MRPLPLTIMASAVLPKHDGDKVQTVVGIGRRCLSLQVREQPEPPALPVGSVAALLNWRCFYLCRFYAQEFYVQVLRAQAFLRAQEFLLRVQVQHSAGVSTYRFNDKRSFYVYRFLRAQEFLQAQVQRALPVQHQLRLPPHVISGGSNRTGTAVSCLPAG